MSDLRKNCNQGQQKQTLRISSPPAWLMQDEEFGLNIIKYVQWRMIENRQGPVYDMKWGHFDRVNSTFKMLLSSWNFDTVFKKIRSFDAKNLGSEG